MVLMQGQLGNKVVNATVLVTGLGLLIDFYDLFLYNMVRASSLTDLGYSGLTLTKMGIYIQWTQVVGLLIGSFFWGPMGDKLGRKRALLGSILVYSLASFACAFVGTLYEYGIARFIIGLGLAGEVGVGAALINEHIHSGKRGYGTMLFGILGMTGILAAALAADFMDWRICYAIGGAAGLLLLLLRSVLMESSMFASMAARAIKGGDLRKLFCDRDKVRRLVGCVLIGWPVIFTSGVIITLSPEIAHAKNVAGLITVSKAMTVAMTSNIIGDIFAGWLSQKLKSRKKTILLFLMGYISVVTLFLGFGDYTQAQFYIFCGLLGFFSGYYITQISITAESFGTNLRATAATLAPNAVRASLVPIYAVFLLLMSTGIIPALWILCGAMLLAALIGLEMLGETFGRDLDYVEK